MKFYRINAHIQDYYEVRLLDEEEITLKRSKIHGGSIPLVKVTAQRVANKKQTTIVGLELWMIDYDEIVPYLS